MSNAVTLKRLAPGISPLVLAALAMAAPATALPRTTAAGSTPAGNAAANDAKTESLRDAIIASLRQNPDIQIALARQDDAKYSVDQARAAYLPRVDLTAATGPEYNVPNIPGTTLMHRSEGTLNVHQNLWDFGVTINDIKRARAAYASAQWTTRGQIEQVSFDIASAYLNMLEKQKLIALVEGEIATQDKMSKMIEVQKDLGLTTSADVSRAKVRADSLQQQLLDAQSQLQQQREAYRRLTGHVPGLAVDLPPIDAALPPTAEMAVDGIASHSPDLASAMEGRRAVAKELESQYGNFFPKLSLDAQSNYKDEVLGRTGRNSDARVVFTMTYNLFNGGADLALKRRIQARLREADYQLDRVRRDVEQDIRIDFQSLQAARDKMATIESQVTAAEKVVSLYREQFRSGQRSVFDLLDSQQALYQANQARITNATQKQVSGLRVLQKLAGLFDLVSEGQPLPDLTMPMQPRRPVQGPVLN